MRTKSWTLLSLFVLLSLVLAACGATPTATPVPPTATKAPAAAAVQPTATKAPTPFTFGVVLVGPYNDHGYSEAHYTAGQYVEKMIPGAKMIYLDKLNSADRKGTTLDQVVSDMISKGQDHLHHVGRLQRRHASGR